LRRSSAGIQTIRCCSALGIAASRLIEKFFRVDRGGDFQRVGWL
jgi:hypothetical protein